MVENFKPGGLRRFGLDYPTVSAANPAIIYASITGFGTGGGKDLPGYDLVVQAMSGLMSLTGDPDGPPYRAGISAFDVIAGLHTAIGILAALHHRARTGQGQHVQASLLSSALSGMVNQTSAYAAGGVVPFRMGNSHPSLFPYEPLPTGAGDLIVTAGNDVQFRKLCDVLGAPELADDPRFASNAGRTANREELRPLLVERLKAAPGGRVVPRADRGGRAVRPDQHGGRRHQVRRGDRPGPGGDGRPGRGRGADDPAPADVLGHRAAVRAAPARARRARRADPGLARRPGGRPPPGPGDPPRGGDQPVTEPVPRFPTSIGVSDADSITLLGQDLAADLMGQVSFGELALWLVTQRRPTPPQVRVFEAVLVALADHGFTPTAIAARLTYLSAPDSVQGALAAGLLGGGSRFLGVTEDTGRFLADALAAVPGGGSCPLTTRAWTRSPWPRCSGPGPSGGWFPGSAIPCTRSPTRARRSLIKIAEEEGLRGPHLRLFEAVGRVHPQVLGRTLPLNGAGTSGAALADLGLPPGLLRGFALLARTAGLLGHLAEEQRRPVGMEMYLAIDRNADYQPPDA